MKKGLVLRGIAVPDWYFEEERRYLEVVCALNELEQKRDSIRQSIRNRMRSDGIYLIDSGVTCSIVRNDFICRRVDLKRLKHTYPSVYNDCLGKESQKRPGLIIRLK